MPRADLPAFLRERENLALSALVVFIALVIGLATLGGYVSPRGAMFFAAILSAVTAAWYARGFMNERAQNDGTAVLLSAFGWTLAALSFIARAINNESRATTFLLAGAVLLVLAGLSLFLASVLVGAKTKPAIARKELDDILRDARDL